MLHEFRAKIRVWREHKKGKVYTRYMIVIPKDIASKLDLDKEYLVILK